MKKRFLLSGIVLSLLVLPNISFADTRVSAEAGVRASGSGTSTEARLRAKAELDLRKKELEERRESLKEEMEEKRENLKKEMEEKREGAKEELETRKETLKDKMEERKDGALTKIQERLKKFNENVIERFEAAVERLEKLAQRIDSRIAKMEAENIDVKGAKDLMVVAKLKIETAKTSISGIDFESEVIASSTATTTVAFKKDFESLKLQIEKAKTDIKAAHAALVDVINSLKPGLNKKGTSTSATSTATTTATTTNSN